MKNKKLSVRVILPVVMSVSIAACIISSMMLFSYLFSSYFKKDAVEKMDRQTISLAQSLENEVSEMLKYYSFEYKEETIKKWYNGYLFGECNVYNPWSVEIGRAHV